MERSNIEAALAAIAARIQEYLEQAQKARHENLERYRSIGRELAEAQKIEKNESTLLAWARKKFRFSRAWVFRLMKLHKEWDAIAVAVANAEREGKKISSVDAAVRLVSPRNKALDDPTDKPKRLTMKETARLQIELESITNVNADLERKLRRVDSDHQKLWEENTRLRARLVELGINPDEVVREAIPVDQQSANNTSAGDSEPATETTAPAVVEDAAPAKPKRKRTRRTDQLHQTNKAKQTDKAAAEK